MIRAQCIVYRGDRILMAKHRLDGEEWWCLPGGGVEPGETAAQAAIRELGEECGVIGGLVCQTSHTIDGAGVESITFLMEIGNQEPQMGTDPEFEQGNQILVDLRWMRLAEIPERDRVYLWAAGLVSVPQFCDEVYSWGDELSYPHR